MTETEQDFIRRNISTWQELESENKYFTGRRSRLRNAHSKTAPTKERVDRYIELYNVTANHLAYVRTFWGETETAEYLNAIVGDAHSAIYSKTVFNFGKVFRFLGTGFPKLFRSEFRFFLFAFLAFTLPALTAFLYVIVNPDNALAFMSAEQLAGIRQEGDYDTFSALKSTLSGMYIGGNNIVVCIEAFAGGLTLGLFTLYAMVTNGLLIGALAGYTAANGSGAFFWSLILPHGVTELFAIWLSGMISRKTAIIVQGKKAIKIMLICVLFLIPSAVIESFFTPLAIPYYYKFLFAGGMAALVTAYTLVGVRKKGERRGLNADRSLDL